MKEAKCKDCGLDYDEFGVDLVLADQHWGRIASFDDLICANCICKRVAKADGVSLLAWINN